MSIKKAKNLLKHNKLSFTTILNEVCKGIRHTGAAGIYMYLASMPENWEICKTELARHFECGKDHINTCWKKLKEYGLIQVIAHKDTRGKITHWETVLNDRIYSKPETIENEQEVIDNSTIRVSRIVENPPCGEPAITNKRDLQTKDRTNKRSIDRSFLSEKEQNLNDLISKKLNNNTITNKQIKDMLVKSTFETISKSIDHALVDQNFHNKMSPVAYFITCILNQGYYPDPLAQTYAKKPRKSIEVTQEETHASHRPHIKPSEASQEELIANQRKGYTTIANLLEDLKKRQQ